MRRREFLANAGLTLGTALAGISGPGTRALAAPIIEKSVTFSMLAPSDM